MQRAKLGTCEEYRPLMQYVVLPALPRDASIEWQVYSTSSPVSITGDGSPRMLSILVEELTNFTLKLLYIKKTRNMMCKFL